LAEQTQWLHVLIDVASGIAEESTAFWSSALAWPLGEPWPGHPEFRSFTPPEGDSYIHQQIGDHGRGYISISRLTTVASPTGWSSWERSSPASLRDGAR
jgi:hypothetical protein